MKGKQRKLYWKSLLEIGDFFKEVQPKQATRIAREKIVYQNLIVHRFNLAAASRQDAYLTGHEEGMMIVLKRLDKDLSSLPKMAGFKKFTAELKRLIKDREKHPEGIVRQGSQIHLKLDREISESYNASNDAHSAGVFVSAGLSAIIPLEEAPELGSP